MENNCKHETGPPKPVYLGDGVYVGVNGIGDVVISVNHHTNEVVVLEPYVLKSFMDYVDRVIYKKTDNGTEQ